MSVKNIFIDIDGVLADWLGQACASCELNINDVRDRLKNGMWLNELMDEREMWKIINSHGPDWWSNLKLLPWAKQLVNRMKQQGDVALLTSPGNIFKNTQTAAIGSYGKTIWANKNFPEIPLIISHRKEFLANENSLLIDDTPKKIKEFQEKGGQVFLWPNQYKIMDNDINVNKAIKDIERKI